VTLTATNSYGNNSVTKTSYITINLAAAPTTTGASCVGPCSVTLTASGSGTLKWYNTISGGSVINTGTSYTTPVLSNTTEYYVKDSTAGTFLYGAKPDNTSGGSGGNYASAGEHYLIFDCTTPVTIVSIVMYGNTTAPGNRTISLMDNTGAVLQSATVNVLSGQHTYTLNFNVPVGSSLRLDCSDGTDIYRNNTGVAFPYTTTGYISVTGSSAGSGYYYYFYNWDIQATPSCISPRVPVTATITTTTGIDESSVSDFGIFPNPNSGSFDITPNNKNYQNITVSLVNVLGEIILEKKITNNDPIHIDVSNLSEGIYFVRLKTEESTFIKRVIVKH